MSTFDGVKFGTRPGSLAGMGARLRHSRVLAACCLCVCSGNANLTSCNGQNYECRSSGRGGAGPKGRHCSLRELSIIPSLPLASVAECITHHVFL